MFVLGENQRPTSVAASLAGQTCSSSPELTAFTILIAPCTDLESITLSCLDAPLAISERQGPHCKAVQVSSLYTLGAQNVVRHLHCLNPGPLTKHHRLRFTPSSAVELTWSAKLQAAVKLFDLVLDPYLLQADKSSINVS